MGDHLNLKWDNGEAEISLEQLQDRNDIDGFISDVRERHPAQQYGDAGERADLLNQYVRLPPLFIDTNLHEESTPENRPEALRNRSGEVFVTFYTYELRPDEIPDEEIWGDSDGDGSHAQKSEGSSDEEAGGGGRSSGRDGQSHERRDSIHRHQTEQSRLAQGSDQGGTSPDQIPTCFAVPLQYLCRIKEGETRDKDELVMDLSKIPLKPRINPSPAGLRIIEFPTHYYAEEFLSVMKDREIEYPPNANSRQKIETETIRNAMKSLSLKKLINNPKVAMMKLKESRFLAGISYHPNIPRNKVVSYRVRGSFLPGTVLFVAIPYLGLEKETRVNFRKKPEKPPGYSLLPGEKQTAFHLVDNLASSSITTLSLFEYNFPRKTSTELFDRTQTKIRDNLIVIHQAWFMVFDNETIAAFRPANDNQEEHMPLFPQHYHSFGAYHALINMIDNILPSWEVSLPDEFREELSELEYSMNEGNNMGNLEDLIGTLNTMKTELSTIVTIVNSQVTILRRLKQFHFESQKEQFRHMCKTIDKVIKRRRVFQQEIEAMVKRLKHLQAAQQHRFQYQIMNTARMQEEVFQKQKNAGITLEDAASQQLKLQKAHGTKISVFTFVTVVFLPLSFLTSYFGMNLEDIRNTTWAQGLFWVFCAPISLLVIIFVYWTALHKDERVRDFRYSIRYWVPRWLKGDLHWKLIHPPLATHPSANDPSVVPLMGVSIEDRGSRTGESGHSHLPNSEIPILTPITETAAITLFETPTLRRTIVENVPQSPAALSSGAEKSFSVGLSIQGDGGDISTGQRRESFWGKAAAWSRISSKGGGRG